MNTDKLTETVSSQTTRPLCLLRDTVNSYFGSRSQKKETSFDVKATLQNYSKIARPATQLSCNQSHQLPQKASSYTAHPYETQSEFEMY